MLVSDLGSKNLIDYPEGFRGFTRGTSTLKIVTVLRLSRNLVAVLRAGCQAGANKKVIPTSYKAAFTLSGFIPKASKTSVLPKRLEVEILKVGVPLPPVLQVSMIDFGKLRDWGSFSFRD